MVLTDKHWMPDDSELTVQEINLSSTVLQASAFYVGKKCEHENNEFVLCRFEEQDPRRCLNEGKAVTSCALDFFRKLKKHCRQDFERYLNCFKNAPINSPFRLCREDQAILDQCVLEKLQIERPDFGYFSTIKVHDTERPKPIERYEPEFPDARKKGDSSRPQTKSNLHSNRYMWF